MATITSFDNTTATISRTRRPSQWAVAGHTIPANANGRNSTAMYTAASRRTSSTHTMNPATISANPTTSAAAAASSASNAASAVRWWWQTG